jgi:FAD/FMN-containing dehydrogenase
MTIERQPVGAVTLDDAAVASLAARMQGPVIRPGDPEYAAARQIWNGMIDKRPLLIARCASAADVAVAVRFAREQELPLAVRGGGHNVAGNAVCDDGLVIDLSRMRDIQVDPGTRTAWVQPGADWGELDRATQQHGLATPGGQVSATGVAGFTLSGGMGVLRRKWGLACDNLLGAEVVTASGEILHASVAEHPDLFWGLRGGGGNFGVVTSFEFALHPLGPEIFGALTIYPIDAAASVMHKWRDFATNAPDEVTCDLVLWGMPPMPGVPEPLHWSPVVIVAGMYAGPAEEGERALQPARELAEPLADMTARQPYVALQSVLDPLYPAGQLYYWKSLFAERLDDDVIDAIIVQHASRPSPQTLFAIRALGGAMGRVPEDATAYGNRAARFNISIDASWQDPAQNDEQIGWTRAVWSQLHELTGGGVYLNFAGMGEENDELARSGHGQNYQRLREVKRRYDPTNLFRNNINIVP